MLSITFHTPVLKGHLRLVSLFVTGPSSAFWYFLVGMSPNQHTPLSTLKKESLQGIAQSNYLILPFLMQELPGDSIGSDFGKDWRVSCTCQLHVSKQRTRCQHLNLFHLVFPFILQLTEAQMEEAA